jgi:hypothetical protein
MTSETSKAISTAAIWLSAGTSLTWGLYKMNGDAAFFVAVTVIIAGAALGATAIVWRARVAKQSGKLSTEAEV